MNLPTKAPACFEGQRQWNEYRALAQYTAQDGWTYCTDCTAEHQARMIAEGRCAFPGTVFKTNNGVTNGRRVIDAKVIAFPAFKRALKKVA